MNLNSLNAIQNLRQSQQDARTERSENFCKSGFEHLQSALEAKEDPLKREHLKAASQDFGEAIQNARSHIDAYIGMAYLLISLHDYRRALDYLKEGQRISAQDPDILLMLDILQTGSALSTQPSKPLISAPVSQSENPEVVLQALEKTIVQALQALMQEPPLPPQPVHSPKDLHHLIQNYQAWKKREQQLRLQLQALSEEMEVLALEQKLHPLELALNRQLQFIRLSKQILQLEDRIRSEEERVRTDLEKAQLLLSPEEHQRLNLDLEEFFDDCDHFADELDMLEQQKIQIPEILRHYEALLEEVENFHETLDRVEEVTPAP
ncbi:hypothetical protein COW36_10510 [bacterium (Candidatus Blackallbacteria) CG17_big_fil_post_rev_8_21_14_2_50_48_46]|uniref:Uncharacterized protein n=1 Tax=bacterium (Candidatus Blackallbacteria) CG17_big_fil_post_rev_8_21_14_2_50_48_46 TaxID=2014261 RepID=A0A2M7G5G3_9BACT|nr:MAG: hypothetical protein COW64_20285 [bacterium (Candidatus Blackallbacteria) CG18_big_fil_WC_8_21_14_2_50_49_26]PIW17062.1 MAG: hypothetical protein COW36_10510 [bacterium (Candidatus Blackallbacteria) CG17_big_fil_post_rev_8_21_14_2_50_48_46]PIW47703.1 MAG: hypothetical protein COW20_11710 [bacterium (Candidatus Blackallbacteria) CG13_big_fil_rev_8_21_14_2_50_49_14]